MIRKLSLCLIVMSAIFVIVAFGVHHVSKAKAAEKDARDDMTFIKYLNSYGLLTDANDTGDEDFARAIRVTDKYKDPTIYFQGFKPAFEPNKPFSKTRIDLTKVMPAADIAAITDALHKSAQKASLSENVSDDVDHIQFFLFKFFARHYADANDPQNAMLIGRIEMARVIQLKKFGDYYSSELMLEGTGFVEKNAAAYPEELARIRPLREIALDRWDKLVKAYRRSPEVMKKRISKTLNGFLH